MADSVFVEEGTMVLESSPHTFFKKTEQAEKEGMDEKSIALTAIILFMRGTLQCMHDITSPCIVEKC